MNLEKLLDDVKLELHEIPELKEIPESVSFAQTLVVR